MAPLSISFVMGCTVTPKLFSPFIIAGKNRPQSPVLRQFCRVAIKASYLSGAISAVNYY